MGFAFVGELFGGCAVATVVGFFAALETLAPFGGFAAGGVAQAIVFGFGGGGLVVVEGCKGSSVV